MLPFRNASPKRREIKTEVTNYNDHKNDLIKDYKARCGYCDDSNVWRTTWFELDHFVPQKYLNTIKITDYSNLVYACRSCNNSKRAHWPTADELVHNNGNEGFIDPCDDEYGMQFSRGINGKIDFQTELGKWMYRTLKLYKPQHEVIWQIEQLDILIEQCEELLDKVKNDRLKDRLLYLYREYKKYTKHLSTL